MVGGGVFLPQWVATCLQLLPLGPSISRNNLTRAIIRPDKETVSSCRCHLGLPAPPIYVCLTWQTCLIITNNVVVVSREWNPPFRPSSITMPNYIISFNGLLANNDAEEESYNCSCSTRICNQGIIIHSLQLIFFYLIQYNRQLMRLTLYLR